MGLIFEWVKLFTKLVSLESFIVLALAIIFALN